jgi:hypothetical protein
MWWTKSGIVMGTEGNGCCPLNCTHVERYPRPHHPPPLYPPPPLPLHPHSTPPLPPTPLLPSADPTHPARLGSGVLTCIRDLRIRAAHSALLSTHYHRPFACSLQGSFVPHLIRDRGSCLPHRNRDLAEPSHLCNGSWLARATSAPGPGYRYTRTRLWLAAHALHTESAEPVGPSLGRTDTRP